MAKTKVFLKPLIGLLLCLSFWGKSVAQVNVRDSLVSVFMFGASGGFNFPVGAFSDRVSLVYPVGGEVWYKFKKYVQIGASGHFMFGERIKDTSFASNLLPIVGGDGSFPAISATFQGAMFRGMVAGLLPIGKPNRNSGLMLMLTGGYTATWYSLRTAGSLTPQLEPPYNKGYDRMSTGTVWSQMLGYQYLSNNRKINFYVGLEFHQAVLFHQRGFQYDVGELPTGSRTDLYLGLRAAWLFPVYKRTNQSYIDFR